ncbi:YciI family protein [Streptomyces sp. NPDC049879]|uniref:YciI family protein n=1 Tax=Streptomyces sp. NPDC049879 TaxID=3365598 RepID=UPI003793FD78
MKYLLMICTDEDFDAPQDELDPTAWVEEMDRRGVRLFGDGLRPPGEATTVRVRDGSVVLTDGPFTETKEQIGGIDVIECADLDEAVEVAARHPMARFGMIEVRPFWS